MSNKLSYWFFNGGRIPRKIKKKILNKKMSGCALRRLLELVTIGEPITTMYERPDIRPYTFCPHCGEPGYIGLGSRVSYPEHWEYFVCIRCRKTVAYIDNSPFIHMLELKDQHYKLQHI